MEAFRLLLLQFCPQAPCAGEFTLPSSAYALAPLLLLPGTCSYDTCFCHILQVGLPRDVIFAELKRVSRTTEDAPSDVDDDNHSQESSGEDFFSDVGDRCDSGSGLQLDQGDAHVPTDGTSQEESRDNADTPEENDVELALPPREPDSIDPLRQDDDRFYECGRSIASYRGELSEHRVTAASQVAVEEITKASIKGELSTAAAHTDDTPTTAAPRVSKKV